MNPDTGFRVLLLSYSQLETAEFFLGRGEGDTAVVVQGIENAVHVTISESSFFDPTPYCGKTGDTCNIPSDCCDDNCSSGKCAAFSDDEATILPWWVWLLVIGGGLLFMYIVYKMARFVGKADASQLFKEPKGKNVTSIEPGVK